MFSRWIGHIDTHDEVAQILSLCPFTPTVTKESLSLLFLSPPPHTLPLSQKEQTFISFAFPSHSLGNFRFFYLVSVPFPLCSFLLWIFLWILQCQQFSFYVHYFHGCAAAFLHAATFYFCIWGYACFDFYLSSFFFFCLMPYISSIHPAIDLSLASHWNWHWSLMV